MSLHKEKAPDTDDAIIPIHTGVSIPDMEESIAWYTDKLGFVLESDKCIEQIGARVVFLRHGDFQIELFQVEGANPLPEYRRVPNLDIQTHGNKHVAYGVKDLRQYVERLKSKNVDVAMDIFPMGKNLVCFIRDNSGNLIELIQQSA